MKYQKASGIILKKQHYRETDQIITIWTQELGKIRVLARGLRLSKSKLAGSLQDLSWVDFEVTGRFPTIISAICVRNYKSIRSDLAKMSPAFYSLELMLKTTADENPNPEAFIHLVNFLQRLETAADEDKIDIILHAFTLKLLESLGFSAEYVQRHFAISSELSEIIQTLRQKNYDQLRGLIIPDSQIYNLRVAIDQILGFVLERELKSQAVLLQLK